MPRGCYEINFYSKRLVYFKSTPKWIYNRIMETHNIFRSCLYEIIYTNDGLFK